MGMKKNLHSRHAISARRELRLEVSQQRELEITETQERERVRVWRTAQKREHHRTWRSRAQPAKRIPLGNGATAEGLSQPSSGEEPVVDLNKNEED
ncbi:hypothetical protein M758_UG104600 [Ceratodon purpureus]|nr:hypothetical protein M758_UG104600 [Ceratodon purpureus]